MTNAAERDGHAADAGVIVGQRAQGGPDERYEVRMVWEEGVLPERSERFSANTFMSGSWICQVNGQNSAKLLILHAFTWDNQEPLKRPKTNQKP